LSWLVQHGRQELDRLRLARDLVVAASALAFSYWSIQGSGYQTVYYGLFAVLLGIPVHVWLKRPHSRASSTAGPEAAVPTVADTPARADGHLPQAAAAARPVSLPAILRRALMPRHQH
jgi:APA family basic amino acid/polyamine antiporter